MIAWNIVMIAAWDNIKHLVELLEKYFATYFIIKNFQKDYA